VKRPSSPWLRPIGLDNTIYFILIGCSHGKLSHFSKFSSDEWCKNGLCGHQDGGATLTYLMSFCMSQWSVSVAAWSARRLSSSASLSTKSSSDELSSNHRSKFDFLVFLSLHATRKPVYSVQRFIMILNSKALRYDSDRSTTPATRRHGTVLSHRITTLHLVLVSHPTDSRRLG